jgi:peptidoglycan hydrolase FlgJ
MVVPLAPFLVSAAAGLAKNLIDKASDAVTSNVKKTATDFESMFLEQSLDTVFSTVGEEGPMGENGTGGSIYRSMLVKEYAGNIVKSGGVGIADQVFREMMRFQEGANHA